MEQNIEVEHVLVLCLLMEVKNVWELAKSKNAVTLVIFVLVSSFKIFFHSPYIIGIF